jgi:phage-related protein
MGFLGGLISALPGLMQWFLDLPGVILSWLPGAISWLWYTGLDIISGMSNGIFNGAIAIAVFFIKLPGMILDWIGNAASWLIGKGMDIISGMWGGLLKALPAIMTFFIQLPGKVVSWIGDALSWLWQKGQDIISGLWNGVQFLYTWLRTNIGNIPGWVTGALGDATQWLVQKGKDIVTGLWNGIKSMDRWFYDRIMEFFKAIIPDPLEKFFGIGSPSKLMAEYGVYISQGLANGLLDSKDLTVQAATTVAEAVSQALTLDPTMTAALDVQANVVGLPSSMDLATMTSQVATGTAQLVATSTTQVIEQTIQRQLSGPQVGPTDQGGWGYVPQQQDPQPVVVQLPEGAMGNETTIHIDSLVLPNIQSSADAQALLDNLKALTDD